MQVFGRIWYGVQVNVPRNGRLHAVVLLSLFIGFAGMTMAFAAPSPLPEPGDVYPDVPDWSRARVLHIGDSQVSGGYKAGLAAHLSKTAAAFHQETWVGSRSKSWVISGKAARLVREFHPNVVIITLGTNIIKYDHPERELSWVRALIDRMPGTLLCYWIGPPPLIPDEHGYNEMMAKSVSPCRYFDTRSLGFPLRNDGKFHLSRTQGALWAEKVWRFMNGH